MAEETKFQILDFLSEIGVENEQENILEGLRSEPKTISSRFFYDPIGSDLFENITHLDEYYPSRAEKRLLAELVESIDIDFRGLSIIELGSGDASKISLILQQLPPEILETISYYPMDVSSSAIEKSAQQLIKRFPLKKIVGLVSDFTQQIHLIPKTDRRLFCFFGSTIGNFTPGDVKKIIENIGAQMDSGDYLLLGVDIIKDITLMEAAYNDQKEITAAFNLNILKVVNQKIGSDFKLSDFAHHAFYNKNQHRMEMHLIAKNDVEINLGEGNGTLSLKKEENIHTENSYKFNWEKLETIGSFAHLKMTKLLMGKEKGFGLGLFQK